MNPDWNLQIQPSIGALVAERRVEHVLVSYDGPQLTLLKDTGGKRYLAVASDSDRRCVRWLQAEVSNLEISALRDAGQSMRNAFLKERVSVVDEDHSGVPLAYCEIDGSSVPDFALPAVGAPVPADGRAVLRRAFKPKATKLKTAVVLGGRPITGHSVSLGFLAKFLEKFEKLCNTLAAGSSASAAKGSAPLLRVYATAPSSFAIGITSDQADGAHRALEQYRALLGECEDPSGAALMLRGMSTTLESAYSDYLAVVESSGLEVLTRLGKETSFLGPTSARRYRYSFPPAPGRILLHAAPPPATSRVMVGYFRSVQFSLTKGTFQFVDAVTDEQVDGNISANVIQALASTEMIAVGIAARYRVEIQPLVPAGSRRKDPVPTLMAYRPAE